MGIGTLPALPKPLWATLTGTGEPSVGCAPPPSPAESPLGLGLVGEITIVEVKKSVCLIESTAENRVWTRPADLGTGPAIMLQTTRKIRNRASQKSRKPRDGGSFTLPALRQRTERQRRRVRTSTGRDRYDVSSDNSGEHTPPPPAAACLALDAGDLIRSSNEPLAEVG